MTKAVDWDIKQQNKQIIYRRKQTNYLLITIAYRKDGLVQINLSLNFACWVIFHAFVVSCRLFSKLTFSKPFLRKTIRVTNGFDPED